MYDLCDVLIFHLYDSLPIKEVNTVDTHALCIVYKEM